ncbi:MAG: hypothetical protein JW909_04010 [Planctomycetes bacterium]|nr:hypothetical protein [Planctomycetota bacterium]
MVHRKPPVSRPLSIVRLGPQHHGDPSQLEGLLDLLRQHRRACDEVWFCTEFGFPPLERHRESARLMAAAANRIRDIGILPGLQIANVLGHGDLPYYPSGGVSWRTMVGPDGRSARMCNCPRDPALHDYVAAMMAAYSAWGPSSVWIDDDTPRMHHHSPVEFACFCDTCVGAFSEKQEMEWTRPSLVKALHNPAAGDLRMAWTLFNTSSMVGVIRSVARAVHDVSPSTRMALQHCGHEWGLYSGPDWKPLFEAMAEITGVGVGSRPGCGFYTDHEPRGMIQKACTIARQVALLPECVDLVCPEVENFTHTAMGKTPRGTAVEASLDLAFGCNCLSFAIFTVGQESFDWYGRILAKIAEFRPFWERFLAASSGTVPGGLEVLAGKRHASRRLSKHEPPFAWTRMDLSRAYNLSTMGLPLCMGPDAASGVFLHPAAAAGLTDDEITGLLGGSVLMDGASLAHLQERGFGPRIGISAGRPEHLDSYERLTPDVLNGPFTGTFWKLVFFGDPAKHNVYTLTPASSSARILGELVNGAGDVTGVATVLAETELGGRIAVFGYDGFEHVVSTARRAQIITAADWVSRSRLPVVSGTAAQTVIVPRLDDTGQLRCVFLLNASIDDSPEQRLLLRGCAAPSCLWITPQDAPGRPLYTGTGSGSETELTVPSMPPWSVGALLLE